MAGATAAEPLDLETALAACCDVQAGARGRPWSAAWWQCAGCRRFSRGDPEKMCIAAAPGYRGCDLVNRRLAEGAGRPA